MQTDTSPVPWHHTVLWREANETLTYLLKRNADALVECRSRALLLEENLVSIFSLMNLLCRQTCPKCTDICCQRAWVWVDFKDLLFLHLTNVAVPEQQLLSSQGDQCRYFGIGGCRLDRIQRPFICTWYLCPSQTDLLYTQPEEKHRLTNTLRCVKDLRRQMEDLFIEATT